MRCAQYKPFFAIRERKHAFFHMQSRCEIPEHFKLLRRKIDQQASQPNVQCFTFHALADND